MPEQSRLDSIFSPLRLLWPAIAVHWAAFRDAIRTHGFAAFWHPMRSIDLGVANLLIEVSEGFIQYESTTVVPSLVEGARGKILDLGPGPGNQMDRFIPSQVDYIYGIEPNPNFGTQLAKKLSGHALEDKYKVLVCGIEDSDILRGEGITENSLDTVLSIQVMCAVNNPRAVMKEIWKLLKPGGRFIFWEHGKNKDVITATAQVCWNPAWSTFVGCNINRNTKQAILEAGEWENVHEIEEEEDPLSILPRTWGTLVKKA